MDNNIVSIKLELSGVIFLSRGHYTTKQNVINPNPTVRIQTILTKIS